MVTKISCHRPRVKRATLAESQLSVKKQQWARLNAAIVNDERKDNCFSIHHSSLRRSSFVLARGIRLRAAVGRGWLICVCVLIRVCFSRRRFGRDPASALQKR